MGEVMAARYWCHMCSQMVNPIVEIEIKCPFCQSGFVEEMTGRTRDNQVLDPDYGSDHALSLWAPLLLGVGNSRRRRRLRRMVFAEDDDDNEVDEPHHGEETELDREIESFVRRRRRSSTTILQLLQGIQAGMLSDSENSEGDRDWHPDRDRDRDRERFILINSVNQTFIVQGSYNSSNGQNENQSPIGSLDDYNVGPGLDLLLQHLAENDPNRYGTPPARKEVIEALPTVAVKETLQCSVCLDDFEVGTEAKEMPCKHKFHGACILPWLELHSSCPVCRFQLPMDESKIDSRSSGDSDNPREDDNMVSDSNNGPGTGVEEGVGEGRNASGRRFSFLWPFNSLFSSAAASQSSGHNLPSTWSSSLADAPGDSSQRDEN